MQIIEFNNWDSRFHEKTAIALGMFDGVHLGHQKVIHHAKNYASEHGWQVGVITLKSHPKEITHRNLKSANAPKLITNLETRLKIFKDFGLDFVLVIDFDEKFMNIEANDYLDIYLQQKLNTGFISVGFDHHFGKNRSGNLDLLRTWCFKNDIFLKVQDAYQVVDTIVSSSLIRNLLEHDKLKEANFYLGYNYRYISKVIHGDHKGHELGFPTANLKIDNKVQLPANGVYKGFCRVIDSPKINPEQLFKTAINLGFRPSVTGSKKLSLEVHLLDFEEDIYGAKLDLSFIEKIRDEVEFKSLQDLKDQIAKDVELCMS